MTRKRIFAVGFTLPGDDFEYEKWGTGIEGMGT